MNDDQRFARVKVRKQLLPLMQSFNNRIVEALSHSPFWPEMVVLGIEDDPQAGWDHVSGYRTTCYVASPYCKRGAVVSTQYNTTSLLRTIEQIGNNRLLSWSTNHIGYTLESSRDLNLPHGWTQVLSIPTITGGSYTITDSATGHHQFFRLRR